MTRSMIRYPHEPLVQLPVHISIGIAKAVTFIHDNKNKRIGYFMAEFFESPIDNEAAANEFCNLINYPKQKSELVHQPVLDWPNNNKDYIIKLPLFSSRTTYDDSKPCVVLSDSLGRAIFMTAERGPRKNDVAHGIMNRVNGMEQ